MTPPALDIHLLVPGLLGSAALRPYAGTLLSPPPESLARLLQRGQKRPAPRTRQTVLEELFGLSPQPGLAALSYLHDHGRPPSSYCLRADPVRLDVGREGLILGQAADIDADSCRTLQQRLSPIFGEAGMRLEILANGHGYLLLSSSPAVTFATRLPASGENIAALMPAGDDAGYWRRLLNECQTQLHEVAFTLTGSHRENTVNSLFFWGGGHCPTPPPQADPWQSVCSDDASLCGAARLSGLTAEAVPENATAWLRRDRQDGRHLIQISTIETTVDNCSAEDWAQAVLACETDWIAPLLQALKEKTVRSLSLLPVNGHGWTLTRAGLRRWWRRRGTLTEHIGNP